MFDDDLIHIAIPGSPDDPRYAAPAPPGVVIHYVPELHPDDRTVKDGLPVTSPSRTLCDMAEISTKDELRGYFTRAREIGLLDMDAMEACFARLEWRPSLGMLREVIDEFA